MLENRGLYIGQYIYEGTRTLLRLYNNMLDNKN